MNKSNVAICIASTRPELLEEMLRSIELQTYKNIKTYIVRYISPVGLAKNTIINKALKDSPDLIQLVDDDDILDPTFIQKQVEQIGKYDYISTWGRTFGNNCGYIHYDIPTLAEELTYNHLHGWMMVKAHVFDHMNFNPVLESCDDWDFQIRLIKNGFKGKIIKEELYSYRVHDNSVTANDHVPWEVSKKLLLRMNGYNPDEYNL